MLETRNLFKVYKPKKGVPVKAIDGISLKFPEKEWYFYLVSPEAENQHF